MSSFGVFDLYRYFDGGNVAARLIPQLSEEMVQRLELLRDWNNSFYRFAPETIEEIVDGFMCSSRNTVGGEGFGILDRGQLVADALNKKLNKPNYKPFSSSNLNNVMVNPTIPKHPGEYVISEEEITTLISDFFKQFTDIPVKPWWSR